MNTTTDTTAEGLFSTLKLVVEAGAVLSALAFAAGWSCLFAYYNEFGLGLFDLDLQFPSAAIFSIKVLLKSVWPWIAFIAGLVGYGLTRRLSVFQTARPWLRDILIFAELLGSAILMALAGVSVGHASALAIRMLPLRNCRQLRSLANLKPIISFLPALFTILLTAEC